MLLAAAAMLTALPADAADVGEKFYVQNCSSCHGSHARGNGKMAALLPETVADLTVLSASNKGRFPTARVIRRIDGSEPVESHGLPRPIWSKRLRNPGRVLVETEDGQLDVDPTLVELVAWLESLQQ